MGEAKRKAAQAQREWDAMTPAQQYEATAANHAAALYPTEIEAGEAIVETPVGRYVPAVWPGYNPSGIQPDGDMILVLPDQAAASQGGIEFTPQTIEKNAAAAETGILFAVGEDAWIWNSDRSRRREGRKPVPGDRIYYERYSGQMHLGRDKQWYRLMTDKCMGGRAVEPEKPLVDTAEPLPAPDAAAAVNIARLAFPRFAVKDGITIMAFNRDEMRSKANGSALQWFETERQAIEAANYYQGEA